VRARRIAAAHNKPKRPAAATAAAAAAATTTTAAVIGIAIGINAAPCGTEKVAAGHHLPHMRSISQVHDPVGGSIHVHVVYRRWVWEPLLPW
jgi:hypothetical protein